MHLFIYDARIGYCTRLRCNLLLYCIFVYNIFSVRKKVCFSHVLGVLTPSTECDGSPRPPEGGTGGEERKHLNIIRVFSIVWLFKEKDMMDWSTHRRLRPRCRCLSLRRSRQLAVSLDSARAPGRRARSPAERSSPPPQPQTPPADPRSHCPALLQGSESKIIPFSLLLSLM